MISVSPVLPESYKDPNCSWQVISSPRSLSRSRFSNYLLRDDLCENTFKLSRLAWYCRWHCSLRYLASPLTGLGRPANVRIQLDHKSLVFSPEESLSITVGVADFHAQPGTLVRCTAGAIKVADGKSSWNAVREQQVDEAGGLPGFQPFHQKTPSIEGAFHLEIKLAIRQADSAAPFKQVFIKAFTAACCRE